MNTNTDEINKPEKYSIKPFDYDEYDAYLNINDIKTNIPDFAENQLDCEMILRICNIVEY
jgi:hypothetical protein